MGADGLAARSHVARGFLWERGIYPHLGVVRRRPSVVLLEASVVINGKISLLVNKTETSTRCVQKTHSVYIIKHRFRNVAFNCETELTCLLFILKLVPLPQEGDCQTTKRFY